MKTSSLVALLCTLFVGSASAVMASDVRPTSTTGTKLEKKTKKPKPATWHKKPKLSL